MLECRHAALVTTPVHLRRMAATEGLAGVASVCRAVFSSGGPLEAETAAGVAKQLGEAPIEILGSTETGGVAVRQRSRRGISSRRCPACASSWSPRTADWW